MLEFVKNFVYDAHFLSQGLRYHYPYNPYKHPHSLIVGATGTGKTVLAKLLLGKIGLHMPTAQVYVLDFKGLDFRFLNRSPRYFAFDGCKDGLTDFYQRLQDRQQEVEAIENPAFLFVDEWAAFVNSIVDKKEQDRIKAMMASILMIGRGLNCFVILAVQRADASLFSGGARDNFSRVIALANISKEAKEMLFRDFKDEMTENKRQGEGYMALDGQPLAHVVVPRLTESGIPKLHDAIIEAVSRY
jgi:DNA segregation ATPase FtsK/SpoIIIE-like protein